MTPFKGKNKGTSPFGPRTSPITGRAEQHRGQDITAPDGDWQVREVTGGTVLRVTSDQWRGKYVDVQTKPGTFERYQHMDAIYVTVGQKVPQGTVLGMAGSTGDVTGRHLHFGVYQGGSAEANAVNPAAWSDVPNTVGTHPGDDNLDGATPAPVPPPTTTLYEFNGIIASTGDAADLEALLAEKQLTYMKKEVSA